MKDKNLNMVWIETTNGCGAIFINQKNIVKKANPIFHWSINHYFDYVLTMLSNNNILIDFRVYNSGVE